MFLTQEPHNIEDFLKSVDFVTPPGMNLKYFIVPINSVDNTFTTISTESGYSPEQELNVPGVTDTITYTKRMPVEKNAMASANFDASAKPGVFPTHIEPAKPQSVDDEIIKHSYRDDNVLVYGLYGKLQGFIFMINELCNADYIKENNESNN